MNAAEILTAVRASGASLRVEGGSLVASNASRLPPEIKTAIRENKPQIITALSVCAQCGSGGDLWHLDTPSGSILIHEECSKFRPGVETRAVPSAAVHHQASGDPGGITTEVRIFTLPPAGRYRKVFLHLQRKPPAHVPTDRWEQAVEDAKTFLRQWGSQAESLGWDSRDLFGLHTPPADPHPSYSRLSRYDATGLIWLLQGRPVIALTEATAAIQSLTGAITVYRRHNKPALGPVGDSLDDLA
jgi:hypothetical protein